ncbi:MAG: hypothetical protein ACP5U0_10345 [Caldisphaera sp.]
MSSKQKVFHIDTNYFIFYLQGKLNVFNSGEAKYTNKEIMDHASTAARMLDILKKQNVKIRLSFLVVGELLTEFLNNPTKERDTGIKTRLLIENLKYFEIWKPDKKDLPNISDFLKFIISDHDKFFESYINDATDYILLAAAFADKESNGFLTFDGDIINNKQISDFIKNKKEFIINSSPNDL